MGSWSDQVEERESREALEWDWSQGLRGGDGWEGLEESREVWEEECEVGWVGVEKEVEASGVERDEDEEACREE